MAARVVVGLEAEMVVVVMVVAVTVEAGLEVGATVSATVAVGWAEEVTVAEMVAAVREVEVTAVVMGVVGMAGAWKVVAEMARRLRASVHQVDGLDALVALVS